MTTLAKFLDTLVGNVMIGCSPGMFILSEKLADSLVALLNILVLKSLPIIIGKRVFVKDLIYSIIEIMSYNLLIGQ